MSRADLDYVMATDSAYALFGAVGVLLLSIAAWVGVERLSLSASIPPACYFAALFGGLLTAVGCFFRRKSIRRLRRTLGELRPLRIDDEQLRKVGKPKLYRGPMNWPQPGEAEPG